MREELVKHLQQAEGTTLTELKESLGKFEKVSPQLHFILCLWNTNFPS
jgi:hypothetical protein